jgi:hypothetical protein
MRRQLVRRCGGSIVCGTIHRIADNVILLQFIVIYGIVACLGVLILILVRYDGVKPQLDI